MSNQTTQETQSVNGAAVMGVMPKAAKKAKAIKQATRTDTERWGLTHKRGRLAWIPKEDLKLDLSYQRDQSSAKINRLRRDWSATACGALVYAERSDGLYVVDGGHRLTAALSRKDVTKLPGIIFPSDGPKEEAAAFLLLNNNRFAMGAPARYNAAIIAEDPIALQVQGVLIELGLTVAKRSSGNSAKQFNAIAWAMSICEEDYDKFRTVMGVAFTLSMDAGISIHNYLLRGLLYLEQNCKGGITHHTLLDRMIDVGMIALLNEIKRTMINNDHVGVGPKVAAEGILTIVNEERGIKINFIAPMKGKR